MEFLLPASASAASPSPTKTNHDISICTLLFEQSFDLYVSRLYWLFKSDPTPRFHNGIKISFSFTDFNNSPNSRVSWDGVFNFKARNGMQDMTLEDLGFFYYSNCKVLGIVGIVKIVKEAYADCLKPIKEQK
ncbi:PUA-like domain-containing protein [Lipomyces japonicus]|uniref:PUA-like domain-containing protein n=1 Tax=Lipomyces japonicus TaxID=56871 RepID=UPI0034CDD7F6